MVPHSFSAVTGYVSALLTMWVIDDDGLGKEGSLPRYHMASICIEMFPSKRPDAQPVCREFCCSASDIGAKDDHTGPEMTSGT